MKTFELFGLLKENTDKALLFQYAPHSLVGANYHITEVKHQKIDSVDCGAGTNSWNETIIQLWESPADLGRTEYLKVAKAMRIFSLAGKMKAFKMDAEVKFEYGNQFFHTAQLKVSDFEIRGDQLVLKLKTTSTDCKAMDLHGIPQVFDLKGAASKNMLTSENACC